MLLGAVYWLEGVFPLFQGRGQRQRIRHAGINIAFGAVNGLVVSLVFSGVTLQVCEWSTLNGIGVLNWVGVSGWARGLCAFVLFDLWMYGWHRVNHEVPFFWRFHRMHHSDLEMDCSSAIRFHTGEIVLSSLARLAVVPALGIGWPELVLYELVIQPVIILHHSNIALPEYADRILRALIVTPNMHRVHHSQVRGETNSNYSTVLSVWDRAGRTFCKREDVTAIRFGLPEFLDAKWQSAAGMMRTPLV